MTGRSLAIALALIWQIAVARADTRRVAVVVGNNVGNGDRPALHYAETDADRFGRVVVELGGVAPADLFLLQGRNKAALTEAFALARQRVDQWHKSPATRVVFVFYFSGHSDGEALELGNERVEFAELRRWLSASTADVRLAVVDTCKSGALLAAKGGRAGEAFQIRLSDDVPSSGEALLTSSAANEIALESREIGGSFFTHHLISGLRGAADVSGDGRVTLAEAYQYAYSHTLTTTGGTLTGPQHPVYDYRLSGQGELTVTELGATRSTLTLPRGFERVLVFDLDRNQVVAELASDASTRLALPAGRYGVRAWRKSGLVEGRIVLAANDARDVAWSELSPASPTATQAKGDGDVAGEIDREASPWSPLRNPAVMIGLGVGTGVAADLGVIPALRLGVRSRGVTGASIALELESGRGMNFRETTGLALVGYRTGFRRGRLEAFAGLELGGGLIAQTVTGSSTGTSWAAAASPWLGVAMRVSAALSITVDGELRGALVEEDGKTTGVLLPVGWIGVLWSP